MGYSSSLLYFLLWDSPIVVLMMRNHIENIIYVCSRSSKLFQKPPSPSFFCLLSIHKKCERFYGDATIVKYDLFRKSFHLLYFYDLSNTYVLIARLMLHFFFAIKVTLDRRYPNHDSILKSSTSSLVKY